MTMWGWIAVAAVVFTGLSVAVTLVIARILGSISAGLNQLLEEETWMSAPLTRAVDAPVDDLTARRARQATRGSRTRS
jgi:hypothetical protein